MNQEHVIILDQVEKSFKVEKQTVKALHSVNLKIKSGSLVALTGKSGAGKSTLLHIIGTLDRPSSGRVYLNGSEVSSMPDAVASQFRNSMIGFVFQMNNLLPEFSALENIMMPGLISGAAQRAVADRGFKLLESVGLKERAHHRPSELSGGEQQRVAIARALMMAPPILLCDEPTGNLDKKTSMQIQELLLQLCQEHAMTMLLVTHDLDLAKRLPVQVVMEDGRVIEGGNL